MLKLLLTLHGKNFRAIIFMLNVVFRTQIYFKIFGIVEHYLEMQFYEIYHWFLSHFQLGNIGFEFC